MKAKSQKRGTVRTRRENGKPRSAEPDAQGLVALPVAAALLQQALAEPAWTSPTRILALQRMAGNRAVSSLIQAKLSVGPVGDRYEQEADRVADQVLSMRKPAVEQQAVQRQEEEELQTKPLVSTITPLVQRQEAEEELQMKPLVQRQEEEELQMRPAGCLQRQDEDEELQMKPAAAQHVAQRQEEELQMAAAASQQVVQSQADAGFVAGPELESRLYAQEGAGRPLPEATRAFMEPRFGADFSGVRIHTGGEAVQLTRDLKAQAFTHGQDIYLGADKYDPGSNDGKRLLAHELTHTIQQTGGAKLERDAASPVQTAPMPTAIQPTGGPSLTSATSISSVPPNAIQRLMDSAGLRAIVGAPKKGLFKHKKYKKLLKKLNEYHKFLGKTKTPFNTKEKVSRLQELHGLAVEFGAEKWVMGNKVRMGGLRTFALEIQTDIREEVASRERRVQIVSAHIEKQKRTPGGERGLYLLRRLREELMRFPTFMLLGRDAGPQRFVDAYNGFQMEYNGLIGIAVSFRNRGKSIPKNTRETLQTRALSLIARINEKAGQGIEPSESPHQQLAGVIQSDFLDKDPELLYEALGLSKERGCAMSADEIEKWGKENAGKVMTLGGVVGENETDNPFRQALFWLRREDLKALYDAFLEGSDEALQPFFFPPRLKSKYINLAVATDNLRKELSSLLK